MDLRNYLNLVESQNKLLHVTRQISPLFEMANFLKKTEGIVSVFENVEGHPNFKVVGNTVSSRDLVALALGVRKEEIVLKMADAMKNRISVSEVHASAPVHQRQLKSLLELPVLWSYPKDRGRYMTASAIIAKDPETGQQNISIHRLLVLSENELVGRIVERHLFNMYQKSGEELEIAIVNGLHPAILLGASTSTEYGIDELTIASALLGEPIPVTKGKTVDVRYPAHAEIVIEAVMTSEYVDEGPFVDIAGKYDIVRKQPLIKVKAIYTRENPYYQALLSAGEDHFILMGITQEPRILNSVKNAVPEVKGVYLTRGGSSWLHGVVSIKKRAEGDGKNAILAALAGHPSMKCVIVTDHDVDIFDPIAVEHAVAMRVDWSKDVIIVPWAKGSSLDPMRDPVTKTNTKIGIDATAPLGKLDEFQLAKLKDEESFDLRKYLNDEQIDFLRTQGIIE